MSTYLGSTLISGVATETKYNANNLLDFKWSDHELNDQSWLKADTFSWQDGTVYSNAYSHLVADYSGGTSKTETIGSYTISFVEATDGHRITTDETAVANIYTESGVAWFYVLDTANQRFKLPRTKYGFSGIRDTVGKYVAESLPNITSGTDWVNSTGGTSSAAQNTTPSNDGCFVGDSTGGHGIGGNVYAIYWSRFDASNSSSVYQDNAPVQQRSTEMYLYFYVGEFSQSATEQTAGLNSELFNNKVDLNLNNMNPSQTVKETIVGWGIPDYSAGIDITSTLFNNKNYTAPTKGVLFNAMIPTNQTEIKINGNTIGTRQYSTYGNYIPTPYYLNNGDIFSVSGWTGSQGGAYFFPLKGVN